MNGNPQGYNTDLSTSHFELFDGEDNDYGNITMLRKA